MRKQKNISPKEKLSLYYRSAELDPRMNPVVLRLAGLDRLEETTDKIENAYSFLLKSSEFFIPFSAGIDKDAERERLQRELEYNQGFLKSVQSKLANERFVSNAKPEVVEIEKRKQADAEAKIRAIEEQLAGLR